ncbi:hypothetical protein K470DRAFT_262265 [Piedraia hortae CBS 480.64]|uniref:Uncharacterized protein n=1 Tax=Piedraia hortae CBS 480.64 TaxID=1314780 RepID=A0A6A7C6M7_9PEZI|nr:hypothetical protein K470DRAFT_262265 [Piedraia hortae CBS 480.64]
MATTIILAEIGTAPWAIIGQERKTAQQAWFIALLGALCLAGGLAVQAGDGQVSECRANHGHVAPHAVGELHGHRAPSNDLKLPRRSTSVPRSFEPLQVGFDRNPFPRHGHATTL